MIRSHRVSALLALLLVTACGEKSGVTAPAKANPPSLDISDGVHSAGNAHFFFLPPIVPVPTTSGTSDGTLSPLVVVCEWNGTACGALTAQFSATTGTGSSVVRYDATAQQYLVNWNTKECATGACTLDAAKTYRLRVLIGAVELGHADLDVVMNGSDLKNVQTGEYIGLVDGRTLPVKFRIEAGAVAVLAPSGSAPIGPSGGLVTTADGSVGLAFPAGALPTTTAVTAAVVATPPEGAEPWAPVIDLGPSGTAFAQPVALSLAYSPSGLPADALPGELTILYFDGIGWEEIPSAVDSADHTVTAQIAHFSFYMIGLSARTLAGQPTPSTLVVGQTTLFTAFYGWCAASFGCGTLTPLRNRAVSWRSSVSSVASVAVGPTYTNASGYAQSPVISALAPGASTISSSVAGVGVAALLLTVQPPPFVSIAVQPDPAGVIPGHSVQLTATPKNATGGTVSGVSLTWSSANPSVATVDANGLVTGIATGVATITASSSGINGSATVRVGVPSISVSATNVTIPVNQGASNQTQINIANGGGGVLSGLQAGPLTNYFNGAATPWVTATLNTTTAPAVLTITAAPGLTIPNGLYQLRFDLTAPGASNSPFTFYSIYVTVIEAGVTPVNASITLSATSVFITVPAGQTRQSQITIGSTGPAQLTNLAAGPFSNVYNGSMTPWVSAAIAPTTATTTAPATLTITAAPPVTQPPGQYDDRFEVSSPGAINSPFPIYSVHITVQPPATPRQVAVGGKSACALRSDGTVVCWGCCSYGAEVAPPGNFNTIGAGYFYYCGFKPDQTIGCWGYSPDPGLTTPPTGTFAQVSVGQENGCALRGDGTMACWGFLSDGRSAFPAGAYKQVSVGFWHSCAIRSDDTALCVGRDTYGQADAPSGTFLAVSAGANQTCGIKTDATLLCWGQVASTPSGTFTQLSSGPGGTNCAIRSDRTIACWYGWADSNPAPTGHFQQLYVGETAACAVRDDNVVLCWGPNQTGALAVPAELMAP